MTASELLEFCRAQGVRLEPHGDKLRVFPRAAVGGTLADALASHKAELLRLLAPEAKPAWPEPSHRDLAAAQVGLDAFCPPKATAKPVGACRCGCLDWVGVAIHGGASLRRDCARCGRFREFVRWHGRRFDS